MTALVLNDGMAVMRVELERSSTRFNFRNLFRKIEESPATQVWVFDGPNNKKARLERYPEYKAHRQPMSASIYEGMKLVKRMLLHTKAIVIEVPGVEGDDVIAHLTQRYRNMMPVVINSIDYDLRALAGHNVHLTVQAKPEIPDELVSLYKLWVGDPSDNIPGVKGFGKTSWDRADKVELARLTANVLTGQKLPPSSTSVSASCLAWLEQNRELFKAFHFCIGFMPVLEEEVDRHTTIGKSDPVALDEGLKEFLL